MMNEKMIAETIELIARIVGTIPWAVFIMLIFKPSKKRTRNMFISLVIQIIALVVFVVITLSTE